MTALCVGRFPPSGNKYSHESTWVQVNELSKLSCNQAARKGRASVIIKEWSGVKLFLPASRRALKIASAAAVIRFSSCVGDVSGVILSCQRKRCCKPEI